MNASNVISHPRFATAPVKNPRTRGRPKGTASFAMARRRASMRKDIEQQADQVRVSLTDLLARRAPTLSLIELSYVQSVTIDALIIIDEERKKPKDE
jgi:hypothetical protein